MIILNFLGFLSIFEVKKGTMFFMQRSHYFGASLKDLGKKWFAFSEMTGMSAMIFNNLKLKTQNSKLKTKN